jgi:hypothetical protein
MNPANVSNVNNARIFIFPEPLPFSSNQHRAEAEQRIRPPTTAFEGGQAHRRQNRGGFGGDQAFQFRNNIKIFLESQ